MQREDLGRLDKTGERSVCDFTIGSAIFARMAKTGMLVKNIAAQYGQPSAFLGLLWQGEAQRRFIPTHWNKRRQRAVAYENGAIYYDLQLQNTANREKASRTEQLVPPCLLEGKAAIKN